MNNINRSQETIYDFIALAKPETKIQFQTDNYLLKLFENVNHFEDVRTTIRVNSDMAIVEYEIPKPNTDSNYPIDYICLQVDIANNILEIYPVQKRIDLIYGLIKHHNDPMVRMLAKSVADRIPMKVLKFIKRKQLEITN